MNLLVSMENPLYRLFAAACPMAAEGDFPMWVSGMASTCRATTGQKEVSEPVLMEWVQTHHSAFREA